MRNRQQASKPKITISPIYQKHPAEPISSLPTAPEQKYKTFEQTKKEAKQIYEEMDSESRLVVEQRKV